ncbi:hypothetical protein [Thermoflexus sp.]|uniref:hypothetical protein n=1 Tax=Thermoflexus sp. TaxID=1969742 RepID=UPI0035E408AD
MRKAIEIAALMAAAFLDGVLLGAMLVFLDFLVLDGPDRLEPVRRWYQEAAGLPPAAVNALHVLSMGPGWVLALWGYGRLSRAMKARGVPLILRALPAVLGMLLVLAAMFAWESSLPRFRWA